MGSDRLLLLLACVVFFLSLGANSIWDANEAFYVETPRQMVLTGDYVTPVFNGAERLNKPVLSYWIVAGFYRVFGMSVGVERLAIAFGALGIMVAAFLIGRALRSTATGIWAALIVATAPRIVFFSRRIFIDVYITLFMSLALAFFVMAERYPERRRKFLTLMYVAVGLGALTKGPIAVVLPALVCLIWLVVERRLSDLKRLMIVPGAVLVLAIVVPWYAAIQARHGWAPISQFFFGENLDRYRSAFTGERPIWFFGGVLFADLLLPWAPMLLVPIATAWRRAMPGEQATTAAIRRLLWLWIVVIVVFFSLSASKEDLYIFPIVAAGAALIADALVGTRFGRDDAGVRVTVLISAAVTAALGAAVFFTLRSGYYAITDATLVAVLLAAAGLGAIALGVSGRWPAAVRTFAAGLVAVNLLFVVRVLRGAEPMKPVPPIARALERASPGSRLGAYNMMLPSLVYYANRAVPEIASADDAAKFLSDPGEAWLVTGSDEWEALRARVPSACVAEQRYLFAFDRLKLESLLHNQPPPGVLLVTNKCRGTG